MLFDKRACRFCFSPDAADLPFMPDASLLIRFVCCRFCRHAVTMDAYAMLRLLYLFHYFATLSCIYAPCLFRAAPALMTRRFDAELLRPRHCLRDATLFAAAITRCLLFMLRAAPY